MEVQATYGNALRIWWAWFWRQMLLMIPLVLVTAFVVGFIVGMLFPAGDGENSAAGFMGGLIGVVVSLGVQIFVIHRLMNKGFGRFRLALMEK